jgi:hypothetical protein
MTGVQKNTVCAVLILIFSFAVTSCGYRVVGSTPLPFRSVAIKHIQNDTYEPRLEERLHNALSTEFIHQGIEVTAGEGDAELQATVTEYILGAVAAIDDVVKEQEITMVVDIKFIDSDRVLEFKSMVSPIKITFQATGDISDSVAQQERATDKACSEIATELVSRIMIQYAK